MEFYYFYFGLLALWVLLLWPLYRMRGWKRLAVLLAVLAGLLATLHEIRQWYGTISAIRLDIPLIAMLLLGLYGLAAAMLFVARMRKTAILLVLALSATCGGMVFQWILIGRESAKVSEAFHTSNNLLFAAKFRDQATYDRTFGPFTAGTAFPAGHWIAEAGARYTRLILNAEGRAWLFYPCSNSECAYGEAGGTLQLGAGGPKKRWTASLKSRALRPLEIDIRAEDSDRLTLRVGDDRTALTKAPPPIDANPAPHSLEFLGAFSAYQCKGRLVDVRQLWLWREAERLYAVGIFRNMTAGRPSSRVAPILLDEGTPEGGAWTFTWDRHGYSWRATVILGDPGVDLVLRRKPDKAETLQLSPTALFRDPHIDLAPLTSKADWDYWFSNVLVGHFSSGDTPNC